MSDDPISFIDASTGVILQEVLVIPKYSSSSGVSTGAGHGPGVTENASFLANPMLYRNGSRFRVQPPESIGLIVGPLLFAGKGVRLNGVVIVANGYRSKWLWQSPKAAVEMEPLDGPDATEHRNRLRSLLQAESFDGSTLSKEERQAFSTTTDFIIQVRFKEQDQELVNGYLSRLPNQ